MPHRFVDSWLTAIFASGAVVLAASLAHCGSSGSGSSPTNASPTGPSGCTGATCDAGPSTTTATDSGTPVDGAAPPATDSGSTATDGGGTEGGGSTLPRLTVNGNVLQDPTGKTIILRGASLIDIGSLYALNGKNNISGITDRLDAVAAAGVQGHVVRMPVYPEITYNSGSPTCSPLPYPVGSGPTAKCTPTPTLSAADYVSQVLKPAVDYATSKSLYVIIDFHQIDNATTAASADASASGPSTSAADSTTFWTDIAPRFANYTNVFYEPFNEPIDNKTTWAALKPVVQGWVDLIRASAPDTVIIVPSNAWDQHTGDAASDPPTGKNFMFTAHIYPDNWAAGFQAQVTTATAIAPVFATEWGYTATNPASFGTGLQTTFDGDGASWTAWVTDNSWSPPMFADKSLTTLSGFGMLVQSWLAAKADSDWVQ